MKQRLPPPITYPLLQCCEHLELPPVATYSGLCLWNYKLLFQSEPVTSLENLSSLVTFTGSMDEQWFYLVSVAIEARAGPAIPLMLKAIAAARDDNELLVTRCLQQLAEIIDNVGTLLLRMYESCDPHVFYNRIRPYLAGSKNMADAGLPRGVLYDDGGKSPTWQQYGGGSNAQSSIIQFFDIVLSVDHRPTGEKNDSSSESDRDTATSLKPRHNFIHEMRFYMPGPHRRFLQAIESVANIKEFVQSRSAHQSLVVAYDACLAMLRALRDKHMQMVSRYIIVKSRESRSHSRGRALSQTQSNSQADDPSSDRHGRTSSNALTKQKSLRGTGGTALMAFLKQARDEVAEPVVDDWVRRYMKTRRTPGDRELEAENRLEGAMLATIGEDDQGEPEIVGLSGSWSVHDTEGGLCAF